MYFYKDLFKSKKYTKKMLLDKNNNFDWPAKYLLRLLKTYQWYLLSNCIITKKYVFNTNAQKYLVLLDLNTLRSPHYQLKRSDF